MASVHDGAEAVLNRRIMEARAKINLVNYDIKELEKSLAYVKKRHNAAEERFKVNLAPLR